MDIFLTIFGALVGWGISHAYYLKALNDLKVDAEEPQCMAELFLRGNDGVGNIEYSTDSSGEVVGVTV